MTRECDGRGRFSVGRENLQEPSLDRDTRKIEVMAHGLTRGVDRLTRRVCRRGGVAAGEVGDALSTVTLALVEKDYAILRRYEGRSAPLR